MIELSVLKDGRFLSDAKVSIAEAMVRGQPDAAGSLYWFAQRLPQLSANQLKKIKTVSYNEIAVILSSHFFGELIPEKIIAEIIERSYDFTPGIHSIGNKHFLELFHGPTLAFKDFGACFMAGILDYFLAEKKFTERQALNILVATSGDTGGAVAQAFAKTEHCKVIILYPAGQISPVQEQQLNCWPADKVLAIRVDADFDTCQMLVKNCFNDASFKDQHNLTSANSINIGRLIPQSFYYFYAWARLGAANNLRFIVPSGNIGNLTAGCLASRIGLPVNRFAASLNANNTVCRFLESGQYRRQKSVQTIANAMDVGNPSNFPRLYQLFQHDVALVRDQIAAASYDDQQIAGEIKRSLEQDNYLLCPHTATASLLQQQTANLRDLTDVLLATAHPAKFSEVVGAATGQPVGMPQSLKAQIKLGRKPAESSADLAEVQQQIREFLQ